MNAHGGEGGEACQQQTLYSVHNHSTLRSALPSPEHVSQFFPSAHQYPTRQRCHANNGLCATSTPTENAAQFRAEPPVQFCYAPAEPMQPYGMPYSATTSGQPAVNTSNEPQEYGHVTAYDMGGPLVQVNHRSLLSTRC